VLLLCIEAQYVKARDKADEMSKTISHGDEKLHEDLSDLEYI
jgi:hypothetical protein